MYEVVAWWTRCATLVTKQLMANFMTGAGVEEFPSALGLASARSSEV